VGVYPYFYQRNKLTRLFAASNLSLALCNLADLVIFLPITHAMQVFLYRLSYVALTCVVWFFFNFILRFTKADPLEFRNTRLVARIICGLLIALSVTPWVVADIHEGTQVPGAAYSLLIFFLVNSIGFTLYLLFKAHRNATGMERNQYKYMFLALFFAFIAAALYFYEVYSSKIAFLYYYVQLLYSLIVAYAIVAHHLMDITVIVRKTVIYSMVTGILAAIMVFVAMLSVHYTEGVLGYKTFYALGVATCVITAIFHPLQLKVQGFVDRHVFRGWADRDMVREVAAGFSHELKSPLAGLSLKAQLMLEELEEVEAGRSSLKNALPRIKEELRYLVSQSMDAARRIEAVRGVAEPIAGQVGPVDVAAVLDGSLVFLKSRLGQGSVAVYRDLAKNLSPVQSNEKQLEIVFINLIKNALDAMEGAKTGRPQTLRVAACEQNGSVLISVKDSGPGIATKDISRIFDPYYTTKGHKGTGMGLYLSQQIVKAHRGSIELKSEEGKGTEFIITLPVNNSAT